tara:strand:+ start:1045 stop:4293 length:3249 start_codon:yes stop_codon:yes gene_type:complete
MSHKPGHFGAAPIRDKNGIIIGEGKEGGYLTDGYLTEKEFNKLVDGLAGLRAEWRYVVRPGQKYGRFIIPKNKTKTLEGEKSPGFLLSLPPSERDLEAEEKLNGQVKIGRQLEIWNTIINPPDRLKTFDDIYDDLDQNKLDLLNRWAGFGPKARAGVPQNDTQFTDVFEDLGLDELGLDERYVNMEEEITFEVLSAVRAKNENVSFKAYDDRTEEDLEFLKEDVVDEMIATQGYMEAARGDIEQIVDAHMFFNLDINPNTGKVMELEARHVREGILLDPYFSIAIDYLEDVTNNVTVSPDVMTRRDFIWAAIESGIESGRINPGVKTMLLFAGRHGIEDIPREGMTRAEQQRSAEDLLVHLNLAERDEEGTVIWDDSLTQIYGQGALDGETGAIRIAEGISEEWFRKLDENLEPYYDNMREVGNSPKKVLDDLAHKTLIGDVERDPADIYPMAGSSALEDKDMYQRFLDFTWDFNDSAESNFTRFLNTTEFTGPNGLPFIYDLDNDESWLQFQGDGRFTIESIKKAARKKRTEAIKIITDGDLGKQYQEQLDAGEVNNPTAYQMFKSFNYVIGEDAGSLSQNVFDQVSAEETAQWKKDITKWQKRDANAIEYLKRFRHIMQNGGYTDRDVAELASPETLGKYSSFNDMLNDEALAQSVLARWQENQTLAFIDPTEYENFEKMEELLKKIAKKGAQGQDEWLGWQNAKAEDKAALYDLLSRNQYESQHAALNDPEFRSAMGQVMQVGYGNYEESVFSDYQKGLTTDITSRFRDFGIINANTNPEFYDFLNNNIIPDIKLQAEMAGVQSDAALDALISNIVGNSQAEYDAFVRQMDSSTPPTAPGMPQYVPSRRIPEPEPAPEFDLTGMTPALLEIAEERPEYATWLQGQMQGQEFQQAWDAASRPVTTFDRESYDEEMDLTDEEREFMGRGIEQEGFPFFMGEPGIRPPGAGTSPADRTKAMDAHRASVDAAIEASKATTDEAREEFMEESRREAEKTEPFRKAQERFATIKEGARERATTVTPGMTQEEFFESRLPGFEDQFKLTREFQQAERRRLADRRRLLATGRGGGGRAFSVFRRGRR